ncbi:hypothetical protein GJ688_06795 [Heliobacillus mobilis]|uniref:Uncharacterized protein n=1 Tax=Heliobacterium mobile TaxID=28064 RepID=A0A6I3SIS7_HELMO|nr:hypothetical protein [Heliobacterium mobile]MTV48685.1 hypothetical protein [Heliobacterium mobile]
MGSLQDLATREKALQTLDEEYRRYRQALEAAFSLAEEMMQKALEPVRSELQTIRERLETMPSNADYAQGVGQGILADLSESAPNLANSVVSGESQSSSGQRRTRPRKKEKEEERMKGSRIRWGNTDDEIRNTVFEQLKALEERGKEITITTIKAEVPSMMRYVYGERALFKGIGDLLEEYRTAMGKKDSLSIASRVIELPHRPENADFDGPDPDPGPISSPSVGVETEAALFPVNPLLPKEGNFFDLSKL